MADKSAPKISTEQLCRDYYDSQIFNPDYPFFVFGTRVYEEILNVDCSLGTKRDFNIFCRELSALNVELFGLAWFNHWFNHNYQLELSQPRESEQVADSALCNEIKFTKSYIELRDGEIWKGAGFYNDTIMQAAVAHKMSWDWSQPQDIGYYMRDIRPGTFEKEVKSFAEDYIRQHYDKLLVDKDCLTRLLNRIASRDAWDEGIMISQKLSFAFAQRLSYKPNTEALFLLQRVAVGLYKNAEDYINAVIEYGSLELWHKEMHDLIRLMNEAARKDREEQNKKS